MNRFEAAQQQIKEAAMAVQGLEELRRAKEIEEENAKDLKIAGIIAAQKPTLKAEAENMRMRLKAPEHIPATVDKIGAGALTKHGTSGACFIRGSKGIGPYSAPNRGDRDE